MNKNEIKVVELFAGVGGFRVGLERSSARFQTIWANQWEPGKKMQYAYDCYVAHFGKENHINEDIALVKDSVPPHDLLVGGFPCQDYSVAHTGARGIEGKKGVLWWEIRDIVEKRKPPFILLENVDRLIKSPANQRGRDFGIMLRCFHDLGYGVEWRVINAADYGQAQKRRRIFIFAYQNNTRQYERLAKAYRNKKDASTLFHEWITQGGFFPSAFPVWEDENLKKKTLVTLDQEYYENLEVVSQGFQAPFYNSGVMIHGVVYSEELQPVTEPPIPLIDIRHTESVEERYFLNGSTERWERLKGAKKIPRIKPNGEPYLFSEGSMCFPDDLNKPGRTMLTSESTVNRSTHVIQDAGTGRLRVLTPIECERLNGFDDNWTDTGMTHRFRYFTMGNALVTPLVTRIGNRILEIL